MPSPCDSCKDTCGEQTKCGSDCKCGDDCKCSDHKGDSCGSDCADGQHSCETKK